MYSDQDLKYTIINIHSRIKKKWKGIVFWGFISDITGKGSTRAIELCRYFGWNPEEKTDKIKLY